MKSLFIALVAGAIYSQPSVLQLIEEQIESVIMIHCVEYEQNSKNGGQITNVNVVYTGNNTIDAVKDSGFYFVYGSYTYDKYTEVNNQVFGNIPNQAVNKSGSTAYIAKVKEVLDEYRVQEIIIIENQAEFDFNKFNYEGLKSRSDMLYPEVIRRPKSKQKKKKK